MKTLAPYVGMATGLLALAFLFPILIIEANRNEVSGSTTIWLLIGMSALVTFFGILGAFIFAGVWTFVVRGPAAIQVTSLAECEGLGSWLLFSWNFYSVGGQQEGFRCFGVEVAIQGRLV